MASHITIRLPSGIALVYNIPEGHSAGCEANTGRQCIYTKDAVDNKKYLASLYPGGAAVEWNPPDKVIYPSEAVSNYAWTHMRQPELEIEET